MNIAYLSLGSNIGERERYLRQAIDALQAHPEIDVLQQSSIYETEPVGFVDQANFLNIVVQIDTSLPPVDLLNECQAIEKAFDRVRTVHWGPRTLDVDILLYNDATIQMERLIVPHQEMNGRTFVLAPLVEIAPQLAHPETKQLFRDILKEATGDVWLYDEKEETE